MSPMETLSLRPLIVVVMLIASTAVSFIFYISFFELFEYVTENFINQSEYPRLHYVIFHIPYSHGNKIEQNLNEIEKSTEFVINKKNIRSSLNVDCNILNVEI